MAHIFFRFLFNYYVLQLAFFSLTLVGGRHVTALQLFFFGQFYLRLNLPNLNHKYKCVCMYIYIQIYYCSILTYSIGLFFSRNATHANNRNILPPPKI